MDIRRSRFTNKAADEKLGTLMDQVAQTVGSVISGAKTQGVDRTKAQTDLLKAQVDRLKAQKELQDAQSALNKGGD